MPSVAEKTLHQYLKNIDDLRSSGNATEQTYRAALHDCLRQFLPNRVRLIHEAKRSANIGAPDFLLQHSASGAVIGCVETKQIGDADLHGKKHNKAQFDRYKSGIPNCLFTDYLNFVFYSDGAADEIRIAASLSAPPPGAASAMHLTPLPQNFDRFLACLEIFLSAEAQPITDAQKLAERMAGIARMLADTVQNILKNPSDEQDERITNQMENFQIALLNNIGSEEFADAYAQTITYGMLAARLNYGQRQAPFTRKEAGDYISKTNPFIRNFFNYNTGHDVHSGIKGLTDSLAALFSQSDIEAIMHDYSRRAKGAHGAHDENPIIHFYETFLSAYSSEQRKNLGVWYTPAPVVKFIVGAVDEILKKEFRMKDGLADSGKAPIMVANKFGKPQPANVHKVQILDPAAGTGTFMAEIIRQIHARFKGQQGRWNEYVENHLLPRLNGFELLIASYAMAHLQLELLLKQTAYAPAKPSRFRVYLTNSLEEPRRLESAVFIDWLAREAREADIIKRDIPVMCVIGNPPYLGESHNKGAFITGLMQDYKKEPGGQVKLGERNPKWLNDDYVKFMRYGQHLIEKNQGGVLAFINAHGFLDNPTFRGMRWHLLNTFDKLYILDLHGNTRKKETAPGGGKDENVFDIMQGVSINLFIKTGKKKPGALGRIYHADLYGTRQHKYDFLDSHSFGQVDYTELPAAAPMYFMVPKDYGLQPEWENGFSVNDMFSLKSSGIVTARDNFTIHCSQATVVNTIEQFLSLSDEQARAHFNIGADTLAWRMQEARKDLQQHYPHKGHLCQIAYRPFDTRWTFHTGRAMGFHAGPRDDVTRHFHSGENIGLTFHKREELNIKWAHILIAQHMAEHGYISSKTTNYHAPLYLYPQQEGMSPAAGSAPAAARKPNLNMAIVGKIAAALSLTFTAEKTRRKNTFAPIDLLDYCYAVLHSPAYRRRFNEFLKTDFPRVPYPQNAKEFWRLAGLGAKLRALHLMQANLAPQTTYPIGGSHLVDKIRYEENKSGKVYINKTQYFGNVPAAAWTFYIGGYQPAQKWLKDRKGKQLSGDDLAHYQKIIATLAATAALMQTIDNA